MNNYIKCLIKQKKKYFRSASRLDDLILATNPYEPLYGILQKQYVDQKNVYYKSLAKKLNDPNTLSKAYWSIINTLVNGKKCSTYTPNTT